VLEAGTKRGDGVSSNPARILSVSAANIDAGLSRSLRLRNLVRLTALALSATSLAACMQTQLANNRSALSPGRQAAVEHRRYHRIVTASRVSVVRRHATAAVERDKDTEKAPPASRGVASFYTEGSETASGEKFDTHELTAAHRTLPFGTRLRVTNVATGQSVTVRVNDRGPYVPGRVVDVSYSAAEALGMVGKGVAKVKLDVEQ
jgi:rare lipoprotein A